jgi:hypothetical protein
MFRHLEYDDCLNYESDCVELVAALVLIYFMRYVERLAPRLIKSAFYNSIEEDIGENHRTGEDRV